MADMQIIKFAGDLYSKNFKPSHHNLATKIANAKSFSDLTKALTHNRIEKMDLFIDTLSEILKPYYRGQIKPPFGDGIRFIQTYGTLPVTHYDCPKADDTVCLKIPNNVNEREEVLKAYIQLDCSGRKPDYLWGEDLFLDPSEQIKFADYKIGVIKGSIDLHYYLLQLYILQMDPWGLKKDNDQWKDYSDYMQNFGIGSLLGGTYDDANDKIFTTINKTLLGTDNDRQHADKKVAINFKEEIEKEKSMTNKYIYHVNQWMMHRITNEEKASIKHYNTPGADITDEQLKKIYVDNTTIDPLENLSAAATCILNIAIEMENPSAKNSSQFCGNDKESLKTWGTVKDKFWYFCRTKKENIVIVMNKELYKAFRSILSSASKYTDKGAGANQIRNLLSYHILPIDNIPYSCIKIHDKNRYNWWTMKDYPGSDSLDQRRVLVWNHHTDMFFGIRKFVPAAAVKLFGLYMSPTGFEAIGHFTTAENL